MSGRGDRGRGRGASRGRGEPPRGASPSRGAGGRGGGPPSGRGGPQTPRGTAFGSGPPRGRGGVPPPAPVQAPPLAAPVIDDRIKTMDQGVNRFKIVPKSHEHPLRPGFGTVGTAINVRANFFALKFQKNLIIHEYKIDITPKTDIARLKGRIIESLEMTPAFQKYKPFVAHDRSERMVCPRELPQPLEVDVTFIEEDDDKPRPNAKHYQVTITKTGQLDTNDLSK